MTTCSQAAGGARLGAWGAHNARYAPLSQATLTHAAAAMHGAPAAAAAPLAAAAAAPRASARRTRSARTAAHQLAPCRAAPRPARRAAVTVHAAAGGPGGNGGGDGRRSLLLALASVAIAVPVSKELVQDLGRGIDEEGSRMARALRRRVCARAGGREARGAAR
jgi:hypothetical protein